MSGTVAVREQEEIGLAELRQRLPELKEKADLVREFQKMVLREGIDYGPIPGTGDRDVLLKPGAESLIAWHGFDSPDPEIEKEEHDWTTGFHYYVMRRTVRSARGKVFTSLRACSTFEKKFRYDKTGNERAVADLNSQSDNALAMADKRALVAVTRLATATSGLFDEEYEDDEEKAAPGLRVPFGRDKGKLVSELTDAKDISWLADAVSKSLTDPAKSRYKPQNERLHAALVARLAELQAPPVQEASTPAPPAAGGATPSWREQFLVNMVGLREDRDPKSLVLKGTLSALGYAKLEDVPNEAKAEEFTKEYLKRTGGQREMPV